LAAGQGQADAQRILGLMYGIGDGVGKGKVESAGWRRMLARHIIAGQHAVPLSWHLSLYK
jgi:TPR repeat protein